MTADRPGPAGRPGRPGRTWPVPGARLFATDRARRGLVDASTGRPPGPQRTCIGCRVRERDVDLLRVVVVAGAVIPDPGRRLPGRGAWLHPDPTCYDRAEQRRAFGRALRAGPEFDTTSVRAYLASDRPGPTPGRPGQAGKDGHRRTDPPASHAQGIEVDPT